MEKPCAIYYLVDPITSLVRYIGLSVNPIRRYKTHISTLDLAHRSCWVKSLAEQGFTPILRVLVWVQNVEEAKRLEIALIAKHQNLTNISTGGEGGTGVWFSVERRRAHGDRMRERYRNPEARAKQSEAAKKGWENLESRAKASAASTGRMQSSEVRAAKSLKLMGHEVTPESRLKMRLSHTGVPLSEETKAKMSATRMGHTVSLEARAKASATHKAMWAKRKAESLFVGE